MREKNFLVRIDVDIPKQVKNLLPVLKPWGQAAACLWGEWPVPSWAGSMP